MKFSVVVLTYNSEKTLSSCLESIKSLGYCKKNYEVIVVDGGSRDGTLDIAKEYDVEIVSQDGKGFSNARNTGIKRASYEYVAFVDSDCEVSKVWLNELSKSLKEGYVAVGGSCLSTDTNHFGRLVSALGYPAGGIKRAIGPSSVITDISTCNMAFRRDVVREIGFFDECFTYGGEDTDFVKRLCSCGDLYFNSKAVVYHKPRESLFDFAKWWHRRGRADVMLHKKYMVNYPFSLFSLKVSRVEHLVLFMCVFGLSYAFGFFVEVLFVFVLFFVFYAVRYQRVLGAVKEKLSLSFFDCFIYVPGLAYMMRVFRDTGRFREYFSYEGANSVPLLLKSVVSRFF